MRELRETRNALRESCGESEKKKKRKEKKRKKKNSLAEAALVAGSEESVPNAEPAYRRDRDVLLPLLNNLVPSFAFRVAALLVVACRGRRLSPIVAH